MTGGGSGIGRAAALALAADGWSVTICGRRREALDETAALAEGIRAVECDVADPDAIARLFADMSGLDLLFNNAGIFPKASAIETIDLADWQRNLNVNLTGYFLATQHALRLMKAQSPTGGRIINNGSVSAHVPRPHAAAYTIAKHGVAGLTKATALEGRAFGIACGQIDIGNAASDMTGSFGTGLLQADGGIRPEPVFDVTLAGRAVAHMAGLPLDANILFMTLAATGMPLVGRG